MREKSPSFYGVDESMISKRDINTSSYSNYVIDKKPEVSESSRKQEINLEKTHSRVEPLNLQRDVDLMIVESDTSALAQNKRETHSIRSKDNSTVKSKYDDFINFLDNVE